MTKFLELMQSNPPRLVVQYQKIEGQDERYQWGIVGALPIMSLVGAVLAVQSALIHIDGSEYESCNEPALVIVYLGTDSPNAFTWFIHHSIPLESLIGMLELIKQSLVMQLAQAMQQQPKILGPDSRPMSNNRIQF